MFFFVAFYCFLEFLRNPSPLNTIFLGIAIGFALVSKFTCVLVPPLLLFLLIVFFFTREYRQGLFKWKLYVAGLVLSFVAALVVLNMAYNLRDTIMPLSAFHWKSALFGAMKNSPIGKIPVPIPYLYMDAIDEQIYNRNLFVYYLCGHLSRYGWAGYYWVALLLKTPIPFLLAAAAAFAGAFRRAASFYERLFWCVPVVFMLAFTFFVRMDMGFRYMYPMTPFLVVLAAGALARFSAKGKKAAVVTAILCVWYGFSIAPTFGNGLAYFNEIAGGPSGGYRYLIESNLDWGQNLVRLKNYVDETKPSPLLVYNYGLTPPSAYGISNAGWVPCEPTRAVVAISVNYLKGIDPFQHREKECFNWLAKRKPVAIIGHGMFVYDTRNDASIKASPR